MFCNSSTKGDIIGFSTKSPAFLVSWLNNLMPQELRQEKKVLEREHVKKQLEEHQHVKVQKKDEDNPNQIR